MGKHRLEVVRSKYGSNGPNAVANSNDVYSEIQRAEKAGLMQRKAKTQVARKLRKVTKQIRKFRDKTMQRAKRRAVTLTAEETDMDRVLSDGLKKVQDWLKSLPTSD